MSRNYARENKKSASSLSSKRTLFRFELFAFERKQRDHSRPLDGDGELSLMACAAAARTRGDDLAFLGHIAAEPGDVFIVDLRDALLAELAHLLFHGAAAFLDFIFPAEILRCGGNFFVFHK